jgi:RNA polymerase sigma factor (TIGR02999 family)
MKVQDMTQRYRKFKRTWGMWYLLNNSGSTGEIVYRQNGGDCVLLPEGMSEITLVLQAVGRGENRASEELLPLVYDELRQLAAARMAHESAGQTLQPTALVHEAWLRLVTEGDRTWQNRAHFFRAAAQAMRRILVDRARHKSSIKCGGGQDRLNVEDLDLAVTTPDDKILLIDDALARLEAEDPESARIITLKFFGGLTNKEVAKTLGVTERTVEREWAYAKARLYQMIQEET